MTKSLPTPKGKYLGPLCVGLLAFPFLYEYTKEFYWTQRLKKLNMDEIISDRLTWLHHCMIISARSSNGLKSHSIDYSHLYSDFYKDKVYLPSDDTFFFVDVLLEDFSNILRKAPTLVLELGSGSGYISTSLLKLFESSQELNNDNHVPFCVAVDINKFATLSTSHMMRSQGLGGYSDSVCMDMLTNFAKVQFDLIIFNPPYVPGEALDTTEVIDMAWNGGRDGSETIHRFLDVVERYLAKDGSTYLLVEKRNGVEGIANRIRSANYKLEILGNRKVIGEELTILKFYKP